MGLLDGLLGGAVGAAALGAVSNLINQHGGIQGIVDQFQKQGLGGVVNSWVGTGQNEAVTPDQVHQALGADTVQKMATQAGVTPQEMATQLAQHLPTAIDKLTPHGTIPAGNPLQPS